MLVEESSKETEKGESYVGARVVYYYTRPAYCTVVTPEVYSFLLKANEWEGGNNIRHHQFNVETLDSVF